MRKLSDCLTAKEERMSKICCPKCKAEGRIDKDGDVVAYGCFFCTPVRLPLKHGIRKLEVTTKRKTKKH
jgi:hypothetical protein